MGRVMLAALLLMLPIVRVRGLVDLNEIPHWPKALATALKRLPAGAAKSEILEEVNLEDFEGFDAIFDKISASQKDDSKNTVYATSIVLAETFTVPDTGSLIVRGVVVHGSAVCRDSFCAVVEAVDLTGFRVSGYGELRKVSALGTVPPTPAGGYFVATTAPEDAWGGCYNPTLQNSFLVVDCDDPSGDIYSTLRVESRDELGERIVLSGFGRADMKLANGEYDEDATVGEIIASGFVGMSSGSGSGTQSIDLPWWLEWAVDSSSLDLPSLGSLVAGSVPRIFDAMAEILRPPDFSAAMPASAATVDELLRILWSFAAARLLQPYGAEEEAAASTAAAAGSSSSSGSSGIDGATAATTNTVLDSSALMARATVGVPSEPTVTSACAIGTLLVITAYFVGRDIASGSRWARYHISQRRGGAAAPADGDAPPADAAVAAAAPAAPPADVADAPAAAGQPEKPNWSLFAVALVGLCLESYGFHLAWADAKDFNAYETTFGIVRVVSADLVGGVAFLRIGQDMDPKVIETTLVRVETNDIDTRAFVVSAVFAALFGLLGLVDETAAWKTAWRFNGPLGRVKQKAYFAAHGTVIIITRAVERARAPWM
ncbi:unnamed protein product [Phaeothamnion confervicola]